MEIIVFIDRKGTEHKLTTLSPMSSYGIPAYRIEDDSPTDYGPSDMALFADMPVNIGGLVALWARIQGRTENELDAARSFLSQNPDGPQI